MIFGRLVCLNFRLSPGNPSVLRTTIGGKHLILYTTTDKICTNDYKVKEKANVRKDYCVDVDFFY